MNIEQTKKLCEDEIAGHRKRGDERYQKLYDQYVDKPQCEVGLEKLKRLEDMVVKTMCMPWELCLHIIQHFENLK